MLTRNKNSIFISSLA